MTSPQDNQTVAFRGLTALKNALVKRGFRCLRELRPQNRNILEIETPKKRILQLRVKTMTKGGWQATINDADANPHQGIDKFWVFVDMGQPAGHEAFYIAPEHWVKKDIHTKHKEYLDSNNGVRVSNNDSLHHAIKPKRVAEWESRWDFLGA